MSTQARIALIGARGSGKTAVGRELALLLGAPFVDLDDEVGGTEPAGTMLARIGEPAFRALELAALVRTLARSGPLVLATGGGVVTVDAARELLARETRCVWLRAPARVLRARLEADPTPRPALLPGGDPLAELEELVERRRPYYEELAHVVVDAAAGGPGEVARATLAALVAGSGPAGGPPD